MNHFKKKTKRKKETYHFAQLFLSVEHTRGWWFQVPWIRDEFRIQLIQLDQIISFVLRSFPGAPHSVHKFIAFDSKHQYRVNKNTKQYILVSF